MTKKLWELFWGFAKTEAITFGGYAILPILQREIVENRHRATEDALVDYCTISQCTSGLSGIHMATYAGFTVTGVVFSCAGV